MKDASTFASLVCGRGLGASSGSVPLASPPEQQVDEGLGALQGALLLRVLPFLLLLLLLLDLCDWTANNKSPFSFQLSRCSMTRLSPCLTLHGDLALGPADGSARPAESQQHGGLRVLPPPPGLLRPDHGVSEQSGSSQAAGGVCARPLRGEVRLDGGLGSLRLRPEQTKHPDHVLSSLSVPTTVHP